MFIPFGLFRLSHGLYHWLLCFYATILCHLYHLVYVGPRCIWLHCWHCSRFVKGSLSTGQIISCWKSRTKQKPSLKKRGFIAFKWRFRKCYPIYKWQNNVISIGMVIAPNTPTILKLADYCIKTLLIPKHLLLCQGYAHPTGVIG